MSLLPDHSLVQAVTYDVIIVGAGIGGLVLALELHQAGRRCLILEAAPELQIIGAGINLLPYAVRELDKLDLVDTLLLRGMVPKQGIFANRAGQAFFREPLGIDAGFGFPQISIHRAALHQILLEAVKIRLGTDCIHTGHACVGFQQDGAGVRALVPTTNKVIAGSILVGCDGLHSKIYKQLYPGQNHFGTANATMWRGVTRGNFIKGIEVVSRIGHIQTGKIVAYPIRLADPPYEVALNWVAELRNYACDGKKYVSCRGNIPDAFLDMRVGPFEFRTILENTDAVLEYPMVDRDPLSQWSHGRVTLLGDAAHPMYPVGSNGAGQAILDAAELRRCLSSNDDPISALNVYDRIRRAATAKIVLSDRSGGPDRLLDEIERVTSGKVVPDEIHHRLQANFQEILHQYRASSGLT